MTPLDLALPGAPDGGSCEPALPSTGAEGRARLGGPEGCPEGPGDAAVFSWAAADCTGAEGLARFGAPAAEGCAKLCPTFKQSEDLLER